MNKTWCRHITWSEPMQRWLLTVKETDKIFSVYAVAESWNECPESGCNAKRPVPHVHSTDDLAVFLLEVAKLSLMDSARIAKAVRGYFSNKVDKISGFEPEERAFFKQELGLK